MENKEGQKLRDNGIEKSIAHAERTCENWAEKAYLFLLHFIARNGEFTTEELRAASAGIVQVPPNNRAWGGIIRRAVIENKIWRIGYKTHKDPKCHCGTCSVWAVKRFNQ
jgi:hypothetical protein